MNIRQLLTDEYKTTLKNRWGEAREIFVNPSKKEMDEVSGNPRFSRAHVLDKGGNHIRFIGVDGKVYVFSPDITHDEVIKKMNLPKYPNAFEGIAEKRGGKWVAIETHSLESNIRNIDFVGANKKLKSHLSQDWSFINKWIDIKPYLKELVPQIKKVYGMKKFTNQIEMFEEFKGSYKHPYNDEEIIEVFKNPSKKEMLESARKVGRSIYLRFIANGKTKTVHTFSPTVLHRFVSKKIGGGFEPKPHELWGVAKKTSEGWKVEASDMLQASYFKKETLKRNWSWLNKWVNTSGLLKRAKRGEEVDSEKLEPVKLKKGKRIIKPRKVDEAFNELSEEFVAYGGSIFRGSREKKKYPIFKNPSPSERKDLSEYVRYAIDGRKEPFVVYIWDGELLHKDAAEEIEIPYMEDPRIFYGIAEKQGTRFIDRSMETLYSIRAIARQIKKLKAMKQTPKTKAKIKDNVILLKKIVDGKYDNRWVNIDNIKKTIRNKYGKLINEL